MSRLRRVHQYFRWLIGLRLRRGDNLKSWHLDEQYGCVLRKRWMGQWGYRVIGVIVSDLDQPP